MYPDIQALAVWGVTFASCMRFTLHFCCLVARPSASQPLNACLCVVQHDSERPVTPGTAKGPSRKRARVEVLHACRFDAIGLFRARLVLLFGLGPKSHAVHYNNSQHVCRQARARHRTCPSR